MSHISILYVESWKLSGYRIDLEANLSFIHFKIPAAYTSLNGKLHVPLVLVVLRVLEEQIVKVELETWWLRGPAQHHERI